MALIIKTPKGIYDTPTDFEMEVEITSPIYTDKGSQTIAATLPGTKHNLSIVDHINRLDIANAPAKRRPGCYCRWNIPSHRQAEYNISIGRIRDCQQHRI